jgi:hypothetical protein
MTDTVIINAAERFAKKPLPPADRGAAKMADAIAKGGPCPSRKPNTADGCLRISNNRAQWTISAG